MCMCVHVWEAVEGETVGDWGRDKEIRNTFCSKY